MRVLAGIAGVLLIWLIVSEFFVTFLLPRRVRRDPRIARGFTRLLWRPWRAVARRLSPSSADTLLGFFGPLALLVNLIVWSLALLIGYGLLEYAVAGNPFWSRFLISSGVFLSAEGVSGSTAVHIIELAEAATGLGVLFIVIGYMPSVYSAFSRRETAVSQLATRGGSPPAAATLLHRAAGRDRWRDLERDLRAWEEWAAELMETHLSYPLLMWYRSQHVNQNWLAALTAMVDVSAFVKATVASEDTEAADLTFRIGRHALADLALQLHLEPVSVDRLSDADFEDLFAVVERSTVANVDRETARRKLDRLRREYEPNAQALSEFLVLDLPPWFRHEEDRRRQRDRDLIGSS
ncbi:MAG TPA: hypothetical protein VKB64_11015 [Gaiellaceae bacterium]|nr:hypothetical protein [Gaiellaceae bacterium]